MNKDDFEAQLLETFKVEADEYLQSIADQLLHAEKNVLDATWLQKIEVMHRQMHSLKGAARAVNLNEVEWVAQRLEQFFSSYRKATLKPEHAAFDVLHAVIKALHDYVAALPGILHTPNSLIKDLSAQLDELNSGVLTPSVTEPTVAATPQRIVANDMNSLQTLRIASKNLDALFLKTEEMLSTKLFIKQYTEEVGGLIETIRGMRKNWDADGSAADTVNRLRDLEQTAHKFLSRFEQDGHHINLLVDELLSDAKKMIMMPFSVLLNSFPSMVRNICHEQNKEVELVLTGTETEIDKRILEEIKEPLIHIVRNSVDHGFDSGAKGQINIVIKQVNGNEVEVIVTDDGNGFDIDAIKKAAIKLGFVTQESANQMGEQEALALLYLSGVSTSPQVTNLSGYGLGMAIVRDKIESMGGRIKIEPGRKCGTKTKINLPITLATLNGIFFTCSDQVFVLPTMYSERIIRLHREDIQTMENKEVITLNNEVIPLVQLHQILAIPEKPQETESRTLIAIIINFEGMRVAFIVDEIQNEKDILVKKLSKPLVRIRFVYGVTLSNTGMPVVILNAVDLMNAATKMGLSSMQPMSTKLDKEEREKPILVVEDSITTRILLKNILEMAGYQVTTANDGQDAWRVLKEEEVSLVVSDIDMPRMNGIELTQKIRNDAKLSELPLILVTGKESNEDRERGIDVGANAYLTKSHFDDSDLLNVIKRFI